MESTARPLELVSPTRTTPPTQAQFARAVQAVLAQHGDIAAEATWQAMAVLVAEHWLLLASEQQPLDTWNMLARCTETVMKVRRAAQQNQAQSGADALEEFRAFMGEVTGRDDRHT